MKKTLIVVGIFIVAMIATAGIFWGCNLNSGADRVLIGSNSPTPGLRDFFSATSRTILDKSGKAAALQSALAKSGVVAARQWLQSEGYSPVDSCVVVFVQTKFDTIPATTSSNGPAAYRMSPDPVVRTVLRSADTIVWQAFFNPTHDTANYTGLATAWRNNGDGETILAELDISTSQPHVIRQGKFRDGVFEPGDVGVETFNECLGDCILPGMFACAMTGPGYLECVGAAATACAIYCAGKSLWDWLNS